MIRLSSSNIELFTLSSYNVVNGTPCPVDFIILNDIVFFLKVSQALVASTLKSMHVHTRR